MPQEIQNEIMQVPEAGRNQSRIWNVAKTGGRIAAFFTVGALAGGGYGAFDEPTHIMIGPHRATATLTLDGEATFEIGGFGAVQPDIDTGPLGIGVDINLKEVPGIPENTNIQAELGPADLEEYARLTANLDANKSDIIGAFAKHIAAYAVVGGSLAVGLSEIVIGKRRRQEIYEALHSKTGRKLLAGVMAFDLLMGGSAVTHTDDRKDEYVSISSAFDGTVLEHAEVKGKYLQVLLNKYGPQIITYIEQNNEFYDRAAENLRAAIEERRLLNPVENQHMVLFFTDLHCNVGMARVIGELAQLSQADIAVDAGDTTVSGTPIEEQCVRVISNALGDVAKVEATGNHDSDETEDELRTHGYHVLDGEAIEVNGLRFIGDDSPMRSVIGQEIYQERDETLEQEGHRLAEAACEQSEAVDIIVTHEPDAANETLARQCAHLGLSGHTHEEEVNTITTGLAQVLQITGGSAGGITSDRPSFGPLQAPAKLMLIKINKETGKPSAYQSITINTDASVEIGDVLFAPRN